MCISSLCMQTNLNPFDQKHTCFNGYSHFIYLPSPSPTPSSPSLTKCSEEVLKNGIPAGCRTEEKISTGEVKEKQKFLNLFATSGIWGDIIIMFSSTFFWRHFLGWESTAILPGLPMMQLIGWISLLAEIISQWFSSHTFLYDASFSD